MIIGISGVARSGKDTFFKLLSDSLRNLKFPECKRLAFADEIKKELNELTIKNFNIDCFNISDKDKEIVRPLMVAYGTNLARALNKNHWIDRIKPELESNYSSGLISVITDVRYENEQWFIKNHFPKSLNVHIHRYGFEAANEEEAENDPKLKRNSDYQISWKSFTNDDSEGLPFIEGFINEKLRRE